MFEDNDWNEQRATTTGQGIVRMTACCEEILKETKRSVPPDFSASLLQVYSATLASPPALLDIGNDPEAKRP